MSVQELFDFQHITLRDWVERPRAWLLKANPVWGSWETLNRIALFDTEQQARAYLEASKLLEVQDPGRYKTKDGYVRSFRPDSLLWDYNFELTRPMVFPALPWYDYEGVSRNPAPPSGPLVNGPREWSPHGIPEVPELETQHPRYGRDYDQGFGGPKTNMDHVVPQAPPLKPE